MMATVDRKNDESAIDTKAYTLLDCFVGGLDAVVYELAEEIAKARQAGVGPGPIIIGVEDVKAAAEKVLSALRDQIRGSAAESEVARAIDSMEQCFKSQCE